jgi:hypothetical protein
MVLASPHGPAKVAAILEEEMDGYPRIWRTLLTLNAHYFSGTSPVCGNVSGPAFEVRNRSGPSLSLRARGTIVAAAEGSRVHLTFDRPWVPDLVGLLVGRYDRDREVILGFLKNVLAADECHDG